MLSNCAYSYTERTPRPTNPINRPAYQGSNPVADIFSMWALKQTVQYLPRVAKNSDDTEAKRQMLYVSLNICAVITFILITAFDSGWLLPSLALVSGTLGCIFATE